MLVLSPVAVALVPADLANSSGKELLKISKEVRLAFAFDVNDERQLVGSASNVFLGRVDRQVGNEGLRVAGDPEPNIAQTQFSVEVLDNIKGDLAGTVTVSQKGGYQEYVADRGPQKGKRVRELVQSEDDPLLEPGQEVLFVTNYDPQNDWYYTVGANRGAVRIKGTEQRKDVVERFKKAKKEQVDPMKKLAEEGPPPSKDAPAPPNKP